MKFRSIPQDIEAIQFSLAKKDELPSWVHVKQEDEVWKVYNVLHDSWINISEGDWIRVDTPNDTYPITDAYLKSKYRAKEDTNG